VTTASSRDGLLIASHGPFVVHESFTDLLLPLTVGETMLNCAGKRTGAAILAGAIAGDPRWQVGEGVMAQRYQREIEEILDQAGGVAPAGKATAGKQQDKPADDRVRRSSSWRVPVSLSPGRLLIVGVVTLLAGLLLPFPDGIKPFVAWLGVGLFVLSYVLFFAQPRRTVERRWRGQIMEDIAPPSQLERFWRWLTRS
jgi:hypothetical protein